MNIDVLYSQNLLDMRIIKKIDNKNNIKNIMLKKIKKLNLE